MVDFAARGVGLRQQLRLAAAGRDTEEAAVERVGCKNNRVVPSPGGAARAAVHPANGDWRPAGNRHFLELAGIEIANPAAVGREERRTRGRQAAQRHRVDLTERADHQLSATGCIDAVHGDDGRPVRSDQDRTIGTADVEGQHGRRRDGESGGLARRRRLPACQRPRRDGSDDRPRHHACRSRDCEAPARDTARCGG